MKRPGYASVASCSLAGVALSIPLMVDQVTFGSYATDAIAILAFVLAITNILCPFLTRWNNKYYQKKHPERMTVKKYCPKFRAATRSGKK